MTIDPYIHHGAFIFCYECQRQFHIKDAAKCPKCGKWSCNNCIEIEKYNLHPVKCAGCRMVDFGKMMME
jgi:hypothetical protein